MVVIEKQLDSRRSYTGGTSDVQFSAYGIAGDQNWSLGGLYKQQHVEENPQLVDALIDELEDIKARRVFAPRPTAFNAKLIKPKDLSTTIYLGVLPYLDLPIHRNYDVPADGTSLDHSGDTGMISAGGCPTVVVAYKSTLLFAHAGRDCVLDRSWFKSGVPGRKYESVVHSLIEELRGKHPELDLHFVYVWVFWSIPTEQFDHPITGLEHTHWAKAADYVFKQYGSEAAVKDGAVVKFDLPVIIHEQFAQMGVPSANIDAHTHAYLPDEFPTTRNGGGRSYLVLIKRH